MANIGDVVRYSDDKDADYRALVVAVESNLTATLAIVKNGKSVMVKNVPHRSAMISLYEEEQHNGRRKEPVLVSVPRRNAGAYWTE